jgi:hypothetical protein
MLYDDCSLLNYFEASPPFSMKTFWFCYVTSSNVSDNKIVLISIYQGNEDLLIVHEELNYGACHLALAVHEFLFILQQFMSFFILPLQSLVL